MKVDSPCPSCRARGRLILKHLRRAKQEANGPRLKYSDRTVPFLYCGHCCSGTYGSYLVENGEKFAVFDPPEETDGK